MSQEGAQEHFLALESSSLTSCLTGQYVQIGDRQIRQGIPLQISPQVLHGVQFRSIRGPQELHLHAPVPDQPTGAQSPSGEPPDDPKPAPRVAADAR